MWINYLKIAWRNLLKYKVFSFLNIGGLAIGMAVAILIGGYILNELQVNRWIPDGDRIFRVYRANYRGLEGGYSNTPANLSGELSQHFPGIERSTYLTEASDLLLTHDDRAIYLDGVAYVDSSFLSVFKIPFLYGYRDEALSLPGTAIISERVALQFFDRTDVVGETLRIDDEQEVTITGVYSDLDGTTHLDYGVFMRIPNGPASWLAYRFETYVRLHQDASVPGLEQQITDHVSPILLQEFIQANFEITEDDLPQWRLQSLGDIHLFSRNIGSIRASTGDARYLYIFGFIALLMLFMAAVNYINLTTARAASRAREIGVRKSTGALKQQLIGQFLTESVVQSVTGTLLALPLAALLLPFFNEVSGRSLSLAGPILTELALPLFALSILVGILAGLYPALVLSGFQTVKVLNGDQKVKVGGRTLRKVLVVGQLTGAVVLIILTSVMYRQVNYMLRQDLGFGADQVMVIPFNDENSWREVVAHRQDWEKHPGILGVSTASSFPGDSPIDYTIEIEGLTDKYRAPEMVFADADYAGVLDLEMTDGRFFSDVIASDTLHSFVVNEAFAKEYELEDPIGMRVRFPWREEWGEIIGVVKDYHYEGLNNEIQPLAFYGGAIDRSQVAVRFRPEQWREVLALIQKDWPSIEPGHPIRYEFLDNHFAVQYAEHEHIGQTFFYSAGLTVLVAILGLFGLATFTAQKRTKEIGIRKVLGASVSELIRLLIRQFVVLTFISGLIAAPLAFWFARRWLADFAYQVPLGPWPFLLGITLALVLTILTVSLQSWRAASVNPVESLRSE